MTSQKKPPLAPKKKNSHLPSLRKRIAQVSTSPGVYRWLDAEGNVLYIGKAKNLRNRLKSYVQASQKHSAWKEMMIRQIVDIDVTLTNSDLEALILETNLIKEIKPKYNIMMKDDKNYVYVRITTNEAYPRIDVVRRMENDGALYFGPKTSADQIRSSLTFLRKIFPFRTCKMQIEPKDRKLIDIPIDVVCKNRDRPTPCLDHHIKQCSAPCIGTVTPRQYFEQSIDGVIAFLQGKHAVIEDALKKRMQEAASQKKYEKAAELRDQLTKLRQMQEKQLIADTSGENTDVIGVAIQTGRSHVVVMQERDGRLVSEESFGLQGQADSPAHVLDEFLPQYYARTSEFPDRIILSEEPEGKEVIEEWLMELCGRKVRIHIPKRGKKSSLLLLAEKNALWKAKQGEAKWESESRKLDEALETLKDVLALPDIPKRIEGYDISHMGGSNTVGSMVVCINGKPQKDHYRSFSIRSLQEGGIDDCRSLQEVLKRRLLHLIYNVKEEEKAWKEKKITFGKARKTEQKMLEKILTKKTAAVHYKEFLVARHAEKIVAIARLAECKEGIVELTSLWVDQKYQKQNLGQFLARKILKSVKKGKVYVTINSDLEGDYGEIGFTYVHVPPKVLENQLKKIKGENIVMMYMVSQHKDDKSLSARPDLIMIDGGKGQLSSVLLVLKELGLTIPVISLAKREEELFTANKKSPLDLPNDSSAKFLLQRLRDEAHRFANSLREKQGKNAFFHSVLDDIVGIGPKMRETLLKKFGSVADVQKANDSELGNFLSKTQLQALREVLPKV